MGGVRINVRYWEVFHKEFIVVHSGLQPFVCYLEVSAIPAVC